ncbi:hypothetical protein [Cupriavidus campinensis]
MLLALLLSLLLSVPTVRAQTLSSDGSMNWGITTTGPSTAAVNGTALVVTAAALTIGLVATGGVPATMVATGRALTLAGQYVGPIAASMLRAAAARGPLTGAMLALALALGSDASYDAASNSFLAKNPSDPTVMSGGGFGSCQQAVTAGMGYGSVVDYARTSDGAKLVYRILYADDPRDPGIASVVYCSGVLPGNPKSGQPAGLYGWVVSSFPPAGTPVAATDAQLSSAAASSAALAKVWDAGGCGAKVKMYRDTVDPSDPCAQIVNNPQGTWSPVNLPNGGYIAFPGKTETTTDGSGNVIGTRTTVPTAKVDANTNQPTMGAYPVIVTPGQVVTTTIKNADGSTTTTTATTTNPGQTAEQPQDGTATFNGGDAALYDKKTKTFAEVLANFQKTLNDAPWMQAAKGFFTVSFGAAACPQWTVAANHWVTVPLDAGAYFCSQTAMVLYGLGGAIVLAVAAWAAFRIAFL